MYKILIKYNDKNNLWQSYGTTTTTATTSTTDESTSFVEFETDDVEVLKNEILKLDAIHGNNNLKIVEDVTLKYNVDVVANENTENNEEQNSGDQL